jgi:hypothetical protein
MNIRIETIHPARHTILVRRGDVTFGLTVNGHPAPTEEQARAIWEQNFKHFWIDAAHSEEDFKI